MNQSRHTFKKFGIILTILIIIFIIFGIFFAPKTALNRIVQMFGVGHQLAQVVDGGNTYYVSTTGDDTNPGTIDLPWKNIERAFDTSTTTRLRGGDTLYIRQGTYRYNQGKFSSTGGNISSYSLNGTAGSPTIISSYPGELATIYLSEKVNSGWKRYSERPEANIWYYNWNDFASTTYQWLYTHSGFSGNSYPGEMIPSLVAIDGSTPTFLQEVNSAKNATSATYIHSVRTNQDDMIAGDFYFEGDTNNPNNGLIYVWLPDGSDPNGQSIEVSLNNGIGFNTQNYLKIANIAIRYAASGAIGLSGVNDTIDGVNLSYNAYRGIVGRCESCVIKDSTFSFNGHDGSALIGTSTLYENNTFEGNNWRQYSSSWECGGMKLIAHIPDITIRGNTFKNTVSCPGLWFDTMYDGQIIEKNTFISDTLGARGLFIEDTNGTAINPIIVRNNVFKNSTAYLAASSYVYVLNNLFINGQVSLHGLGDIDGRRVVSNNKIINNIFYYPPQTTPFPLPVFIVQDVTTPYEAINNISDHNLFYEQNSQPLFFGGTFASNSPYNLSQWLGRGYDLHSTTTDPLFVSSSTGNYNLRDLSPAIGFGQETADVTDDFSGNPRTGRNDIGPFQSTFAGANAIGSIITSPTVSVSNATTIDQTTAILNGSVTNDGNDYGTIRGFNWGTTNSYGNTTQLTGTFSTGAFTKTITGLSCATTYHYRSFATNSSGTGTSPDTTFTTPACPVVSSGSSGGSSSGGSFVSPIYYQYLFATSTSNTATTTASTTNSNTGSQNSVNNYSTGYSGYVPQTSIFQIQTPVSYTPTGIIPKTLTSTLSLTDNKNEVALLQKILNAKGYTITTTGYGSPGNESTYFGQKTLLALQKFQCDKLDVCFGSPKTNGYGLVGPRTRGLLNGTANNVTSNTTPDVVKSAPVVDKTNVTKTPPVATTTKTVESKPVVNKDSTVKPKPTVSTPVAPAPVKIPVITFPTLPTDQPQGVF